MKLTNELPPEQSGEVKATRTEYAYFEGQYIPVDEAKLSIRTHAFLYGTSLFEGIRAYWLPEQRQFCVFRMVEHYERLIRNSKVFYLTYPFSVEDYCAITVELIRRNQPETDLYVRPTLFKTGVNITPTLEHTVTDFCLWTKPLGNYLDLSKGLNVCVSSWRRLSDNAIPARAKAGGAYMNTALAVTDARNMGFDDAIFLTESGTVSEGSAMNLFLIKDGVLVTPSKTEDILEGITRDSIMTIARNELNLETVERTIDRSELYHADEAFFCGTGAQVAPITRIDNRPVGDGQIGELTRRLQSLYFDVAKGKVPQYSHWCTMVSV